MAGGLFGDTGLQADVKLSFAPKTYVELGSTIFFASVASWLLIYAIKRLTGGAQKFETGGATMAPPTAVGSPAIPVV